MKQQPWIGKPWIDTVFILLPPFLSLLLIAVMPSLFQDNNELPVAGWVILILLIDVAHVYSTLYRTYFDPHALKEQRSLLWTIPFFSFIAGVLLYSMNDLLFWRILAYVAVYHFVRQQYGFMRVYSRKENVLKLFSFIDRFTIYYATLYPVVYWHLSGPRNFHWFVEDDFVFLQMSGVLSIATGVYFFMLVVYLGKELFLFTKTRTFNVPKTAIIAGTILSWYFGIVHYNGDMAFTLLNVVSHGIPYMALVWLYGKKTYTKPEKGNRFLKTVFSAYGVVIFVGLIFLFAFVEEGLWDLTVWKEHKSVFGTGHLFNVNLDDNILSFIVPLLAVPQITHYILEGFIWKIRNEEFKWSSEVKSNF
jgi:hypothetical protein